MHLRWMGSVALLVALAVAALLLCPLAHGSYSATHGPGTDLRARQFRSVLMFVIAAAGFALTPIVATVVPEFSLIGMVAASVAQPAAGASISPLRR